MHCFALSYRDTCVGEHTHLIASRAGKHEPFFYMQEEHPFQIYRDGLEFVTKEILLPSPKEKVIFSTS